MAIVPPIEAHIDHSGVASVASNSSHAPSVRKAGSASRSGSSCQSRDIVRSAMGESDPSSLAEFDVMKFRNNYLQVPSIILWQQNNSVYDFFAQAVEELRMRRVRINHPNQCFCRLFLKGRFVLLILLMSGFGCGE